jgi:hypothetical protein
LLALPNIKVESVNNYGDKFLDLIKDSRRQYKEMMAGDNDVNEVVHDPNHSAAIVISSDEEDASDDEEFASESTESDYGSMAEDTSPYFHQPADVVAFNNQCKNPDVSPRAATNPPYSGTSSSIQPECHETRSLPPATRQKLRSSSRWSRYVKRRK